MKVYKRLFIVTIFVFVLTGCSSASPNSTEDMENNTKLQKETEENLSEIPKSTKQKDSVNKNSST
ncbi:MAG: hypothetical protein K2N61_13955 [Lachnospiraceae bacterium]|nr:hypothetical protein [Lachnospiraceae bacterium]